jgi:murein L,D-transpeptidase YcbB/YkuD
MCGALAAPGLTRGNDNLPSERAFERAQGGVYYQNFNNRRKKLRRRDDDEFRFFYGDPEFFQYRRSFFDKRRKKRLLFEGIDPEPDLSRLPGKPKSPDSGFENYQPVKLVALSNPDLVAPKPDKVLASTIWGELRDRDSSVRVTAKQRDAIINFYRLNTFQPLWVTSEGLTERAKRALALLARADEEGLNPVEYLPPSLGSFSDDGSNLRGNVTALAQLDIGFTAMAVRYAEHLHSGRIIPKKLSGYYDIEPPSLDLGLVLYELSYRSLPDLYLSSLAPSHPAYAAMKASLAEMRAKEGKDVLRPIPQGDVVKRGEQDARVPLVRERLLKLGFLSEEDAMAWMLGHPADEANAVNLEAFEITLDKTLSAALKAFQADHKIKATGRIDKASVAALNARAADQNHEQKLIMNMERVRWLPRDLGARHIMVNQAAFELRLVDGKDITWSTKVIVGKPETQTFVFSDEMEIVVINPYWGVPQSIIRYEMMPYLARDRGYLDRQGYEVVSPSGKVVSSRSVNWWAYGSKIPYGVRQPPGDDNALGRIKFLFPNSHDIYMHDTPTKKLFAESVRAFSHGCIRVEDPRKFAEYVLGWDRERIDGMIATGENKNIRLDKHIPVYLNYFTAWPDESGKITFYADIYQRDARLDKALNTIAVAAN